MRRTAVYLSITLITFFVGISVSDTWNTLFNTVYRKLPEPRMTWEAVPEVVPSQVAERELFDLYQQYTVAQTDHDVAFFERVEPENFVLFDRDGKRYSRSEDIELLQSSDRNIRYSIDELRIQHYHGGAIVTGRMTAEYPTKLRFSWRWIDVCVRRDGRWQILSTTQLG